MIKKMQLWHSVASSKESAGFRAMKPLLYWATAFWVLYYHSRESKGQVVDVTPVDRQANAARRQGVDHALLRYAGMVLVDAPTGVIYDVGLPPTLAGIQAQATLINPSTFSQTGLTFNEFTLPHGTSFMPSSSFVALVYRRISSFTVYTLPPQYQFGGPVVGIISSSSNFTSIDPTLPQASISLSPDTLINIALPVSSSANTANANLLCAFFASNGSIFVNNLVSLPNLCTTSTLGDFALVVQVSSSPLSPRQTPSPPASGNQPTAGIPPPSVSTGTNSSKNWKHIVGVTCLVLAGLAFLVAVVLISIKLSENLKLFFTSRFTGNEEALQSSLIGGSRAPTAGAVRTKPALEIDMAHFTR